MNLKSITVFLFMLLVTAGSGARAQETPLNREAFQRTVQGKESDLFFLNNSRGMEVAITNYGGRIVRWTAPDRHGSYEDVVLGFDALEGYKQASSPSFGATIGRYASRIAEGRFYLDGEAFNLPVNVPPNHLHGGWEGFFNVVFDAEQWSERHLRLRYVSPDGEAGYPGNLSVQIQFTLTENNELKIEYVASTDKPTVVSLSNHTYFNLAGKDAETMYGHRLYIHADRYTPVDSVMIPTGEITPVDGTPFDFREPTFMGEYLETMHPKLASTRGYDHHWVLNRENEYQLVKAAVLYEPESARKLEIFTTKPGLYLYGGNFFPGTDKGKGGRLIKAGSGLSLLPQYFPDAPNRPEFPSARLDPGEWYHEMTIYRFSTGP
ncbi:aldose epimerase family protein [Balneolaceae bacterium ANBcel3]|nr:aldose epimerase family protein [Balneolaceae bacterium ANBcel3]